MLAINITYANLNRDAVSMVKQNKERIDRLDELVIVMLNAETAVRGFLVTHEGVYLAPYQDSLEKIGPLLDQMNKDYEPSSPSREQFEEVRRLSQEKLQHLQRVLDKGALVGNLDSGGNGIGKRLMDKIRVLIASLKGARVANNETLEQETFQRLQNIQTVMYALVFSALFLILGVFYIQQKQAGLRARIHQLLEHKNSRLESVVALRTAELSELANHLTTAREEERKSLAHELHDEMGATLTVAKMDASALLRTLDTHISDETRTRFRRLIEGIGSAISIKRRIIDDLQPPLLKGLGLVEALRALCENFQLDMPVEVDLPETLAGLSEEKNLPYTA
ncbi:MAG: hypothetical protein HC848_06940 [Limnobacter sp.]|nr:hypothetical protein [Limnobacter sp.]